MGDPAHRARRQIRRPRPGNWWAVPVTGLAAAIAVLAIAMAAGGISLRATSRAARLQAAGTTAAAGPGAAAGSGGSNCTLIVPANPLTARGLATPYQLTATGPAAGPCHESTADQAAFVQGAVIDPVTGKISVYDPLVVDAGTAPAVAPVLPSLPARAVVALWFGFNGNVLTLRAAAGTRTLAASHCVNGLGRGRALSPFSQMAYCNARAFFRVANRAARRHQLTVPSPGTGVDGLPCLTTRSFALVDQDQSDNVTTQYLVTGQGQIAQDTAATRQRLTGAAALSNGSDNGLLDSIMDPALGCSPWLAPDLADGGAPAPALPLDELQAARFAGRTGGPAALVPLNDPMVTAGGAPSAAKTNAYRAGVDQPPLPAGQSPARYCRALERIQGRRLQQDVNLLIGHPSPVPGMASNLFTFLATRLQQSFGNLGCGKFGLVNDVTLTAGSGGTTVAACFREQARPVTPGPGNPAAGQRRCPATAGHPAPAMPASASPSPSPSLSQAPSASPSPSPSQTAASPPSPSPSAWLSPAPRHTGTQAHRQPGTPAPWHTGNLGRERVSGA